MKFFADDTILILTGIPCIGKTTTAYQIIRQFPFFQRVVEMDTVSDTVRATLNNLIEDKLLRKDTADGEYSALFESITIRDLDVTKLQAEKLLPYVKSLVLRQQKRKLPTIIEGAEIIPTQFFPDNKPLEWLNENVIFINLYISDEREQRKRRNNRYSERKYPSEYDEIIRQEALVVKEKNLALHTETLRLAAARPNVFSLDISDLSPEKLAERIMQTVENYFHKTTHL